MFKFDLDDDDDIATMFKPVTWIFNLEKYNGYAILDGNSLYITYKKINYKASGTRIQPYQFEKYNTSAKEVFEKIQDGDDVTWVEDLYVYNGRENRQGEDLEDEG